MAELSIAAERETPTGSVRERVSPAEWQARVDLAAAYRLIAHYGLNETIYNHISLAVPGEEGHFLLNAFGLMYEEITASSLVKVTIEGKVVDDPTGIGINRAGFVIHGAIHAARRDVKCVLHTHSIAGMAVAAQEEGLLPISQHAAAFHGRVGYHDFEGVALDVDEQKRLVRDLGEFRLMILRNHGLLTAGRSVVEALQLMLMLEKACVAQLAAMNGGARLRMIPPPLVAAGNALFESLNGEFSRDWRAFVRLADRIDPGYRS